MVFLVLVNQSAYNILKDTYRTDYAAIQSAENQSHEQYYCNYHEIQCHKGWGKLNFCYPPKPFAVTGKQTSKQQQQTKEENQCYDFSDIFQHKAIYKLMIYNLFTVMLRKSLSPVASFKSQIEQKFPIHIRHLILL